MCTDHDIEHLLTDAHDCEFVLAGGRNDWVRSLGEGSSLTTRRLRRKGRPADPFEIALADVVAVTVINKETVRLAFAYEGPRDLLVEEGSAAAVAHGLRELCASVRAELKVDPRGPDTPNSADRRDRAKRRGR